MFSGWALSFEPRMRSWVPEADGDAVRVPAVFCACLEASRTCRLDGLCFLPVATVSLSAAVVASSAFAEARYSDAPPSTSSSAATATSGGRINERMGSPGCPSAVHGVRGVAAGRGRVMRGTRR